MLWCHHFIQENDDAEDKIWSEHMKSYPKLRCEYIRRTAVNRKDVNLMIKLISRLKTSLATKETLGKAYGTLLEVHESKGDLEKALRVIQTLKANDMLDSVSPSIVQKIKNGLEAAGKSYLARIADE